MERADHGTLERGIVGNGQLEQTRRRHGGRRVGPVGGNLQQPHDSHVVFADFDGLSRVHPAVNDRISVDPDSRPTAEVDEEGVAVEHLEVGVLFAHARVVELGCILRVPAEEDEWFVEFRRFRVARDPVGTSNAIRLG